MTNNDLQNSIQKNRQYNDEKEKTNKDLQNTTQKNRQYNDQKEKTNKDRQNLSELCIVTQFVKYL